jgi:hypothetical protein
VDEIQEPGSDPATQPKDHDAITPTASSTGRAPTAEPADQSELDLGVISTGSPAVDEALQPLESLAEVPVGDHPEVLERVLGELSATLSAPEPPTGAVPESAANSPGPSDGENSSGDTGATASGH